MNPFSFLSSLTKNNTSAFQSFTDRLSGTKKPTQNQSYVASQFNPPPVAKPVVTPSNSSATSNTVTPPANPAVKTPAAQSYINNTLTPQQQAGNDAYLASKGMDPSGKAIVQNNTSSNSQSSSSTPPPSSQDKSPDDPYLRYITGVESANTRLADIQNEGDKKSLEARREKDRILDESGGLLGGAQSSARMFERRSNSELADLALKENAAARSAQVAQGLYDSYLEKGKTEKADKQQETTNKLAQDKFDEDKRQFGLQYALEQQKINNPTKTAAQEAKDIAQQEKEQASQQQASQSIGLINSILPNASSIAGIGQNPLNYVGLSNSKTLNEYNQLQGLLKLGVRQLIKGQGAVSDYEGKILGEASSSVGRNLNNKDFETALKKTRGVLKTNNGMVTNVTVTNPSTGEQVTADLSGSEIYHLVSEGNVIDYN